MNETLSSSSEWMQFYQQNIDSSFGFSDATAVTTSCVTSGNNLSPSCNSFVSGDQYLTPKGCISKPPVRRRSRSSKGTPTTHLNADAKNFRSLVQQFTGCGRRDTCISFGNPRGPVNINFAVGTDHASATQSFVEHNYSGQAQLQQQEEHHQQHYQYQQQQVSNEEQECEFSFDSITTDHDDDLLTSSCLPRSGSQIPQGQGFVMDDMYFLA